MLKGKTALVTGSTSGIGLGIALTLARQGAHVVLNGFGDSEGPIKDVQEAGKDQAIRVGYHGADMSKPAEIEAMMAYVAQEFGACDILVNNAGIQHVAPVDQFPTERWDAIIAINLSSAFHTTRLALPGMKARGWGRVLNIASVHGLVASAEKSAYVAAKHGIVGLTKAVALETESREWAALDTDFGPEKGFDPAAKFKAGPKEIGWRTVRGDSKGYFDLAAFLPIFGWDENLVGVGNRSAATEYDFNQTGRLEFADAFYETGHRQFGAGSKGRDGGATYSGPIGFGEKGEKGGHGDAPHLRLNDPIDSAGFFHSHGPRNGINVTISAGARMR